MSVIIWCGPVHHRSRPETAQTNWLPQREDSCRGAAPAACLVSSATFAQRHGSTVSRVRVSINEGRQGVGSGSRGCSMYFHMILHAS